MTTTFYVYDINTGFFVRKDSGSIDMLLYDCERTGLDFTLTRPPSVYEPHKWNGLEWVKVETET